VPDNHGLRGVSAIQSGRSGGAILSLAIGIAVFWNPQGYSLPIDEIQPSSSPCPFVPGTGRLTTLHKDPINVPLPAFVDSGILNCDHMLGTRNLLGVFIRVKSNQEPYWGGLPSSWHR
jgi:simple sugar transport system permease protein